MASLTLVLVIMSTILRFNVKGERLIVKGSVMSSDIMVAPSGDNVSHEEAEAHGNHHSEAEQILHAGLVGAGVQLGGVEIATGVGALVASESAMHQVEHFGFHFFPWAGVLHRGVDVVLAMKELINAGSLCEVFWKGGKVLLLSASLFLKFAEVISLVNFTGTTKATLAIANGALDVGIALGTTGGFDPCAKAATDRTVVPDDAALRLRGLVPAPKGDEITNDELHQLVKSGGRNLQDLVDKKQATIKDPTHIELVMQSGATKTFEVDLRKPLRGILAGASILSGTGRDLDDMIVGEWNVQPDPDSNMWDEQYFMRYGRHRGEDASTVSEEQRALVEEQRKTIERIRKRRSDMMAETEAWRRVWYEKPAPTLSNYAGLRPDFSLSKAVHDTLDPVQGVVPLWEEQGRRIL